MGLYEEVRYFNGNFLNLRHASCVAYLVGYHTVSTLSIGIMFHKKLVGWSAEYQRNEIIIFGLICQYRSCFFWVKF